MGKAVTNSEFGETLSVNRGKVLGKAVTNSEFGETLSVNKGKVPGWKNN